MRRLTILLGGGVTRPGYNKNWPPHNLIKKKKKKTVFGKKKKFGEKLYASTVPFLKGNGKKLQKI